MLFPQFVCVFFISFVNTAGVYAGSLVGFTLIILGGEPMFFIPLVLKYLYFDYNLNKQTFPFKTFLMLTNFAVTFIISACPNFISK